MDTTKVTSGVRISVQPFFRKDLSDPTQLRYFFNYRVQITNENNFEIQLISRDWYIFDSLGDATYVNGQGVIGEQPHLKPGESFDYVSGCELISEFGYMKGFYTFKNLDERTHFEATIPSFSLEYPCRLN